MEPLCWEIWKCFLLAYVGFSVILYLVSRFSPYEWQLEHNMGETSLTNDFNIVNTFWFCLSAFMQQGIDIAPKFVFFLNQLNANVDLFPFNFIDQSLAVWLQVPGGFSRS